MSDTSSFPLFLDMAPPKTKDALRGTIHGTSSNSLVSFTLRAVPLPPKLTAFLQANTSTMRRIQPDRRGARSSVDDIDDSAVDAAVASKALATGEEDEEARGKEVKPEDFWAEFERICEGAGRDWAGVAERIWAFGPKRVGANLLIDKTGGAVKS